MSTLWTPGGEHPVGPAPREEGASAPQGAGPAAGGRAGGTSAAAGSTDEEALAQQVAAMRAELAGSPADVVVVNHCYGLFELAAVYMSEQPPLLEQARLAIDAFGCLVEGLSGRLGDAEPQLKEALSQMRLAYVQIEAAKRAGADATSGAAANGGSTPSEQPSRAEAAEAGDAADAARGTGRTDTTDGPSADG